MARSDEPGELAPLYLAILELLDQGQDHVTIASTLDLDVEAVPGLVELATAKRTSRRLHPRC